MSEATRRFKLASSDKESPTWGKLRRHIEERMQQLRAENDGPLDAALTAALRGRIAELKLLLATAEENPPPIDMG